MSILPVLEYERRLKDLMNSVKITDLVCTCWLIEESVALYGMTKEERTAQLNKEGEEAVRQMKEAETKQELERQRQYNENAGKRIAELENKVAQVSEERLAKEKAFHAERDKYQKELVEFEAKKKAELAEAQKNFAAILSKQAEEFQKLKAMPDTKATSGIPSISTNEEALYELNKYPVTHRCDREHYHLTTSDATILLCGVPYRFKVNGTYQTLYVESVKSGPVTCGTCQSIEKTYTAPLL